MATKKMAKDGAFSVIKTGGKQYRVVEGEIITIEKLSDDHKEGDKVTFEEVLLSDDGSATKLGAPLVSGAKVQGEVVAVGKGKKVRVEKFKAKTGYHKVYGHRQPFVKVKITSL